MRSLKSLPNRYQRRYARRWLLMSLFFIVLISIVSCAPAKITDTVETLRQRLQLTLDIDLAELNYAPRPDNFPSIRTLKPTAGSAVMSLLTSLQLGHCRAGQLIAQRNSSLGRLEDGVMRYQQDLLLVEALQQCIDKPQSKPLAKKLQQAYRNKRQQLSRDLAFALATDDALRHTLTIASQPLTAIDDARFDQQLLALQSIVDWLTAPTETDKLPLWREQLVQSDYIPQLLRSVVELRLKLEQLQRALPDLVVAAGCDAERGTPKRAQITRKLFMTVFIGQVQKSLAQLVKQYRQLSPVLKQLKQLAPQTELKDYLHNLAQQGDLLNQRSRQFVQPWQRLFNACNFVPGA